MPDTELPLSTHVTDAIYHALKPYLEEVEPGLEALRQGQELIPPPLLQENVQLLAQMASVYGQHALNQTALSLVSFLRTANNSGLAPGDKEQIATLLENIRRQVRPSSQPVSFPPIPRPSRQTIGGPHRILLYLDNRAVGLLTEEHLQQGGFQVSRLAAMNDLFHLTPEDFPLAILADISRCRQDPETAKAMAWLQEHSSQPVHLCCLSGDDSFALRLETVRLGASRFIRKPLDKHHLLEMLDSILARRQTAAFRVLLVDDDQAITRYHAEILQQIGCQVRSCNQPELALAHINDFSPDVIVTDIYMPGCNGLELAAILRQDETLVDTPILFLSSETDPYRQMQALDLGADDFLSKPVPPEIFQAAVLARAHRARTLKCIHREQNAVSQRQRETELAINQHCAVSITDAQGAILYVNERFCEISGYARHELVGQNHRLIKSSHHSPDYHAEIWDTISRGQVWSGQICNRRQNGELYWVNTSITPLLDPSGLPVRYIATRTDISLHKHLESSLTDTSRHLSSILNAIHEAFFMVNQDGIILEANPAAEKFLGYGRRELLGQSFLLIYPFYDRERASLSFRDTLTRGRTDKQLHLRHKEGWLLPALIQAQVGEVGSIRAMVFTIQDISERCQQETALLQARQQAKQLGQTQARLLADLGHALDAPLQAITGTCQQLTKATMPPLPPDQASQIRQIHQAGAQLQTLIGDLLDLARIESGYLQLEVTAVNIDQLLQECLHHIRPQAEQRAIRIHTAAIPTTPLVLADRAHLKQVLLRLLDNSIRYNREKGEIHLKIHQEALGWRVEIIDTGPGIPVWRQRELFQPFSRENLHQQQTLGAGIGLALTRRWMAQMSGYVGLISEEAQGSNFWIWLPAAPKTNPPEPQS